MNVKGRLEHIAIALGAGRRLGKTTLIAKACKDLDGVLLGANVEHAKHLERQYQLKCKSIKTNLQGIRGPFFIDHYATEELLYSAVRKIEELERENKELKTRKDSLEFEIMAQELGNDV